ncbi:MAG: rhomboid family intramembrane serine protease [Clostridiales bacterium]|nr:rhomboid family intramembrane serine protease [Clostridiales bacterium]
MRKISAAVDRFCYNHPNFGIPNLMLVVIVGNIIVYVMDLLSSYTFSSVLAFIPAAIFQGQIWRLISFVFVPESSSNVIVFAITLYFYYFIGTQLEKYWGTARFNVFYFAGVLLSILTGFIIAAFNGGIHCPYETASIYYVNMSLFFSFATLYPDMRVLLFYIIPIKVKYLAWLDAALFAIQIIRYCLAGMFVYALLPVIALLNYFIFFGADLMGAARRTTRRVQHQTSSQTIHFKKAAKETQQHKGYLHKCCVCGRTDQDYPDLEFRYCSRCAGYRCYCIDHINNHVHVTED